MRPDCRLHEIISGLAPRSMRPSFGMDGAPFVGGQRADLALARVLRQPRLIGLARKLESGCQRRAGARQGLLAAPRKADEVVDDQLQRPALRASVDNI